MGFNLKNKESRNQILGIPCPYCYVEKTLGYTPASTFMDSFFFCFNCACVYPMRHLMFIGNLSGCQIQMSIEAKNRHDFYLRKINEYKTELSILKKECLLWKSGKRRISFNPSSRRKK